MKKNIIILTSLVLFLSLAYVSSCTLTPTLINQDPYPVSPGDYVKLVFQVSGMGDPTCGNVTFQLVPNYPISFDPGVSSYYSAVGGVYATNYNSFLTIPYMVRVDPNAVKGNDTLTFAYAMSNSNYSLSSQFNLSVSDIRSNFSIFVENYNPTTKDLTLNILNTAQNDANSVTVTIPSGQQNVTVDGPNTYIVGLLSSNDYTTADFNLLPNKGNINLIISYNDVTGVRRSTNETVYFDPTAFPQPSSNSPVVYVVILLILLVVAYVLYRRHKKNKKKKLLRE
ncbi:MAG: hypothetical protein WAU65_00725 [Candidatus Nanoarchaeia archaeon]